MDLAKTKKILDSRAFKIATWAIAALLVLLVAFKAGMMVGYREAAFSYRWNENYYNNFAGREGNFLPGPGIPGSHDRVLPGFDDREFMRSGGADGQILKIEEGKITIKDRDNLEKIIVLTDKTVIRKFDKEIEAADLKEDDHIVVIGDPNDSGQIEAKLIRLMPGRPAQK
jgi:hypothetical protein